MQNATSVRVAAATRDAVRALAEQDGLTLDEEIARLARVERPRRMGQALAETTSPDDDRWLDAVADSVNRHAGR
jgi:hypothetical protein